MNVVEKTIEVVTPKILNNLQVQEKESNLLSQFAAIFIAKIAGTAELEINENETGASIIQSVFKKPEERGELISKLSEENDLDNHTTQKLLAQAAPLIVKSLNEQAGVQSLQVFLKDKISSLGTTLPSWSSSLLPASILGGVGALTLGASNLASGVASAVGAGVDKAGDLVGDVASGVGAGVDKAGDLAGDVASGVGTGIDKAGDLASSAVSGVASAVGTGVDKVGDLAGDVASGVGAGVDKAGDLASGAVIGVASAVGVGVDKVGDLAGDVASGVGAGVDKAGDLASSAVSGVASTVGAGADKAVDLAGDVASGVGAGVDKAGDLASSAVNKVEDLGAGAASAVTSVASAGVEGGSTLLKKLFPILGLIGLGIISFFLWNSCSKKPTDMATNTDSTEQVQPEEITTQEEPTETIVDPAPELDESTKDDAVFNLATGAGDELDVCSGNVGNDSLKAKITTAITSVFGSAEKCDNVRVMDTHKTVLANEDKLEEAFTAAKAVPYATLNFNGDNVVVNAKDTAARAGLVETLSGILPGYTISEAEKLDVDSVVKKGIEGSLEALGKLEGTTASGNQIAAALNIQVINFASGTSNIPTKNKVVLDKAALLLAANKDAKILVTGHTDSTGNAQKNQALSESRAKDIKDYLISKGASAEQLISKGVGSSESIASDATKEGQFMNRRISFDANSSAFDSSNDVTETGEESSVLGTVADTVAEGANAAADAASDGIKSATETVVEGVEDAGSAIIDAATESETTN